MATKEELLREIDIVTTFSSQYNMKDAVQAEKSIKFFEEKGFLKTQIGTQYLARLKDIKDGKVDAPCFICKKNLSYDGVLCDECMSKYTRGKKNFFGRDDFADLNALFEDVTKADPSKSGAKISTDQIKSAADTVKAKAADITSRVQDRLQEEDVQKAKEQIKSTAAAASEKAKQFVKDNDLDGKAEFAKEKAIVAGGKFKIWWGERPVKQRIIFVVLAIILVSIIGIRSTISTNNDIAMLIEAPAEKVYKIVNKEDFTMNASGYLENNSNVNPSFTIDPKKNICISAIISQYFEDYDKYTAYGVKIGDSHEKALKAIKKIKGGEIEDDDEGGTLFRGDNWIFSVTYYEGKVTGLSIMDYDF